MQIDTTVALSQFVGSLPTFIAVILAWMHSNGRFSDLHKRIDDTQSSLGRRIDVLDKRIDDTKSGLAKRFDDLRDLIRAESAVTLAGLRRVEEVMDARLKHLEENR